MKMEKVFTKVWKVQLKIPVDFPKNKLEKPIKKIDWSFKLMLN